MSKQVKRFLLVGRVVRKKLTRATQQKLEAVKERRQRSNCTAAIFFGPIFVFNQGTELVFAGFLTLVSLYFVLARVLDSGQSLLISWFSCFSHTSSLLGSQVNNGRFGTNLGILSDCAGWIVKVTKKRGNKYYSFISTTLDTVSVLQQDQGGIVSVRAR